MAEITKEEAASPEPVDLQGQLDVVRKAAEENGLAIVVTWYDEYGGPQSVTLRPTDKMQIGVPL